MTEIYPAMGAMALISIFVAGLSAALREVGGTAEATAALVGACIGAVVGAFLFIPLG